MQANATHTDRKRRMT